MPDTWNIGLRRRLFKQIRKIPRRQHFVTERSIAGLRAFPVMRLKLHMKGKEIRPA